MDLADPYPGFCSFYPVFRCDHRYASVWVFHVEHLGSGGSEEDGGLGVGDGNRGFGGEFGG